MDKDSSSLDPNIIEALKGLESQEVTYPPELLAARRASFISQVTERAQLTEDETTDLDEQRVLQYLKNLKAGEDGYPAELLAARRAQYKRQVAQVRRVSLWEALMFRIQNFLAHKNPSSHYVPIYSLRTSLTVAAIAMAAFAGLALYANQSLMASTSQDELSPVGHRFLTPTEAAQIICKDGYLPPLCLAREIDKSHDLTYPGNGTARPAVAKDTMPGYGRIHRAENVNDGLYGPGASWVSNSPNSWIKIDLGKPTAMNTVTFGRDRLGNYNDGDPGRFVIAVATSDDVYANGNSSNDELEYAEIYDSEQIGFDGTISGSETVTAQFDLLEARYIKITFENARTAIDEVEVFVSPPPVLADDPTQKPDEELSSNTAVAQPSGTSLPANTATLLPTDTPVPLPTASSTPIPTDIPTDTPVPLPTDTPILPTDTPVPIPTDTPVPADTQSVPPTEVFPSTPVDQQILSP